MLPGLSASLSARRHCAGKQKERPYSVKRRSVRIVSDAVNSSSAAQKNDSRNYCLRDMLSPSFPFRIREEGGVELNVLYESDLERAALERPVLELPP